MHCLSLQRYSAQADAVQMLAKLRSRVDQTFFIRIYCFLAVRALRAGEAEVIPAVY